MNNYLDEMPILSPNSNVFAETERDIFIPPSDELANKMAMSFLEGVYTGESLYKLIDYAAQYIQITSKDIYFHELVRNAVLYIYNADINEDIPHYVRLSQMEKTLKSLKSINIGKKSERETKCINTAIMVLEKKIKELKNVCKQTDF